MPGMSFKDWLKDNLGDDPASSPFNEMYGELKEIADSLGSYITGDAPSPNVRLAVEPGFQSRLGQRLDVTIGVREPGAGDWRRDVLFRAYVPPDGTPVALDFFGEEPTYCESADEMKSKIQAFLARPEVRSRLAVYKKTAESSSP